MNIYVIEIHAGPGVYGQDAEGNQWTTFTLFSHTRACTECGAEINGGYVRGMWREEDLWICTSHVRTQYHAHNAIIAALETRIHQMEARPRACQSAGIVKPIFMPSWRYIDDKWTCLNCPLWEAIHTRDDSERLRLMTLIDATRPEKASKAR